MNESSDVVYFHVLQHISAGIDQEEFRESQEMYQDLAKSLVSMKQNPENDENFSSLLAFDHLIHDVDKFFFNLARDLSRRDGEWKRNKTRYEFPLKKGYLCRFYKCEVPDDDEEDSLFFWKFVCLSSARSSKFRDKDEVISSGYSRDHLSVLQNLHDRISRLELHMERVGNKGSSEDD